MKKIKLKIINTVGSKILKYLDKKNYSKVKEIYFSETLYQVEKGWNMHLKTKCFLVVVYGKVKFTVFNKQKKLKKNYILSRKDLSLLVIPKGYWFKYKSLSKPFSIICNSINIFHNVKELIKRDVKKFELPE
jgi:dTDP-4-dehydrorhamnose 3,5-epimerase-like enzyme